MKDAHQLGLLFATAALTLLLTLLPFALGLARFTASDTAQALGKYAAVQLQDALRLGSIDWNQVANLARQLGVDSRTLNGIFQTIGGASSEVAKGLTEALKEVHSRATTLVWVLLTLLLCAVFAVLMTGKGAAGLAGLAAAFGVVAVVALICYFFGLVVNPGKDVFVNISLAVLRHVAGVTTFVLVILTGGALAGYFVMQGAEGPSKPRKLVVK